jgi:outer membrane protein assembly factor BamB
LNPAVLLGGTRIFTAFRHVSILAALATAFVFTTAAAQPSITLSPTVNHPSSQVTVSGSGFGAGKGIDIYWDTTDELLVVSNSTGAFSTKTIPVPASALPGTHWVTALERDNGNGAQAAFTVRTDWAEHGFGARGRRYNPYENVISSANAGQLGIAWSYATGGVVESSPAVVGGIVYIGSNDGYLYALNAATGALQWKKNVRGVDYSSPAVANGIVYVGSHGSNSFYALNASTGATKWSDILDGAMEGSPTVANGVVYIGTNNGSLWALNPANGNPNWIAHTTAGAEIYSAPAVFNGAVYIGSGDDNFYEFDAASGNQVFKFTTGGAVLSSPAAADRWVYIGSYDTAIYAFSPGSLSFIGSYATGDVILSSPAIAKQSIYIGSADSYLYSFSPINSGPYISQNWRVHADGAIYSSPAVANGVVYFGANGSNLQGALYAVDASSGALLWQEQTGDSVTSSPAVANGMVYVGSYDHNVYAFALDSGANAVYHHDSRPPSFALLHADLRLKPVN